MSLSLEVLKQYVFFSYFLFLYFTGILSKQKKKKELFNVIKYNQAEIKEKQNYKKREIKNKIKTKFFILHDIKINFYSKIV